jgi:hypothetical protein
MATHAAIVERRAKVNARLWSGIHRLAELTGVDVAPPFPNTRDKEHKANNQNEQLAITVERIVAALEGEPGDGGIEVPHGERPNG